MALPDFVIDSLDSVEESEQQFFDEHEGKYKFNAGKYAEAQKQSLVRKNADLVKRVNANKAIADKFKDVSDEDYAAFQQWKDERDDAEHDDNDGNGDGKKQLDQKAINKMIRDAIKKHDAENVAPKLTAKDKELEEERKRFNDYRFQNELTALALDADVIPSRLKAFKNALVAEGMFGYVDGKDGKDGKLVVLDEDGEPTTDSAKEKLQKLANDEAWKYFFAAKEPGGGGGKGDKGSKSGSKTITRAEFDKLPQHLRDKRMSEGYQLID